MQTDHPVGLLYDHFGDEDMKAAMSPERWTPKGEDPEEHYRRIFEFEKNHFSSRTIYNVFWSANNYSIQKKQMAAALKENHGRN